MSDRELLELAARAMGFDFEFPAEEGRFFVKAGNALQEWNPLVYDSDALRIAVRLQLDVRFSPGEVGVVCAGVVPYTVRSEATDPDPYVATRLAIVRAAAAIGKDMK